MSVSKMMRLFPLRVPLFVILQVCLWQMPVFQKSAASLRRGRSSTSITSTLMRWITSWPQVQAGAASSDSTRSDKAACLTASCLLLLIQSHHRVQPDVITSIWGEVWCCESVDLERRKRSKVHEAHVFHNMSHCQGAVLTLTSLLSYSSHVNGAVIKMGQCSSKQKQMCCMHDI